LASIIFGSRVLSRPSITEQQIALLGASLTSAPEPAFRIRPASFGLWVQITYEFFPLTVGPGEALHQPAREESTHVSG